jgi:hypothetical protein
MDKIHFNRYIHPFETIDEFFLALYIVNKMQSDLFSSHDIHQAICSTIIQITFKESTDFVEKIKGYKYHYPSNLKYKLHDIDEHIEVTEHFNVAALQSHSKQKNNHFISTPEKIKFLIRNIFEDYTSKFSISALANEYMTIEEVQDTFEELAKLDLGIIDYETDYIPNGLIPNQSFIRIQHSDLKQRPDVAQYLQDLGMNIKTVLKTLLETERNENPTSFN